MSLETFLISSPWSFSVAWLASVSKFPEFSPSAFRMSNEKPGKKEKKEGRVVRQWEKIFCFRKRYFWGFQRDNFPSHPRRAHFSSLVLSKSSQEDGICQWKKSHKFKILHTRFVAAASKAESWHKKRVYASEEKSAFFSLTLKIWKRLIYCDLFPPARNAFQVHFGYAKKTLLLAVWDNFFWEGRPWFCECQKRLKVQKETLGTRAMKCFWVQFK